MSALEVKVAQLRTLLREMGEVVICFSGARMEHILPDGRTEPSTLQTGEIAWRRGATHIGHNLDKTDLWVIAIEPK